MVAVTGMHSKRASYEQKQNYEIPKGKKFRSNVADLFLCNEISGSRTRQLLEDHVAADKDSVSDLLSVGAHGKHKQNISRDLIRRLKKKTAWPPLYYAYVRIWDLKRQQMVKKMLPFLLPHELVGCLWQHAKDQNKLFEHGALCQQSLQHLQGCAQKLQVPESELVAAGIWGDGVPMNFDRKQSLEVFSFILPGLTGESSNFRFPITVIPKKYLAKPHTKDDVLSIIAWSFENMAAGRYPASRHDGAKWHVTDVWRKKQSLKRLPRTILCEVKGDWAFMKETFRFPQHNENAGCCWLCTVKPNGIRDASLAAPWRANRLTHWQLLNRIREQGHEVSPIFSIPFIQSNLFLVDWLHAADQGISAVFLASLFFYMLPKFPGQTDAQRISALFLQIRAYYDREHVESRLDNLTLNMLGKKTKPKLRAKAAEARALINFACELVDAQLNSADPIEGTVQLATRHLHTCYTLLSPSNYNKEALASSCRKFCILLCELEHRVSFFCVIPKMHLFQELCEMSAINPSLTWCYRDEDFGGSIASISRVRGGANRAFNVARSVLLKFLAQHKLPRL